MMCGIHPGLSFQHGKGACHLKDRKQTKPAAANIRVVHLRIPVDLIEEVDQNARDLHMSRSEYVAEMLRHGSIQLSIPDPEVKDLLIKIFKLLDEIRKAACEIMLQQKRSGVLTSELKRDLNKIGTGISEIRNYLKRKVLKEV